MCRLAGIGHEKAKQLPVAGVRGIVTVENRRLHVLTVVDECYGDLSTIENLGVSPTRGIQ
jgi:hypothetical protein